MGLEELLLDRAAKKGMEKGVEKGIEKGEHQKALEIARELKKEGATFEFIAKITKLSIEQVEKL